MAKPVKSLELHYPMIQFLIISVIGNNNRRVNGEAQKQVPNKLVRFTCNPAYFRNWDINSLRQLFGTNLLWHECVPGV